jgi:NADPH2:quinone reductase
VPRSLVPGIEASGRIVAVGEGVDDSRVGEPVTALSGELLPNIHSSGTHII